jgi:hypothetical protein
MAQGALYRLVEHPRDERTDQVNGGQADGRETVKAP